LFSALANFGAKKFHKTATRFPEKEMSDAKVFKSAKVLAFSSSGSAETNSTSRSVPEVQRPHVEGWQQLTIVFWVPTLLNFFFFVHPDN
jgi:hypothetical protein